MIIQVLLFIVLLTGTLLLLRSQFHQRSMIPDLISARQLRLRTISSSLLIVLFGMLLFGNDFQRYIGIWGAIAYWGIFVVLFFVLLCVTLMDLSELRRNTRKRLERAQQKFMNKPHRNGTNDKHR